MRLSPSLAPAFPRFHADMYKHRPIWMCTLRTHTPHTSIPFFVYSLAEIRPSL